MCVINKRSYHNKNDSDQIINKFIFNNDFRMFVLQNLKNNQNQREHFGES